MKTYDTLLKLYINGYLEKNAYDIPNFLGLPAEEAKWIKALKPEKQTEIVNDLVQGHMKNFKKTVGKGAIDTAKFLEYIQQSGAPKGVFGKIKGFFKGKGGQGLMGAAIMLSALGMAEAMGLQAIESSRDWFSRKRGKKELARSFKEMFKEHPSLKEDPKQAEKMFKIVSTYSPALAKNPIVAGSLVNQLKEQVSMTGVIHPDLLAKMTGIQKNYDDMAIKLKDPRLQANVLAKALQRPGDVTKAVLASP